LAKLFCPFNFAGLSAHATVRSLDSDPLLTENFIPMAMFGILSVNKPAGCSSRHVVDRVERVVRPAKAGHAGTLDPLATGVLVICVGKATRLIPYVQQMPKLYRATFLLGQRSETDDTEGELIEIPNAPVPSRRQIDDALLPFLGEIEQVPPAHSAVKVDGRRAYKLARKGRAVTLAARRITIHRLVVLRYDYPELELEIECGGGTYVRSLGRDLAELLHTGAVMCALERSAIGRFRIAGALRLDDVTPEMVSQHLQAATTAIEHIPQVTVDATQAIDLRNGRPIASPTLTKEAQPRTAVQAAIGPMGELVALVHEKRIGELWPTINFAD
jgi:tRNA pseudouridine55 synthase